MRLSVNGLRIGLICVLLVLLTGCRDATKEEEVVDAGRGCEFSCVTEASECPVPGGIVEGVCPEEAPLCCDPEARKVEDTGGKDTGAGDTYPPGVCQYECLDFIECPMRAVVEVQECEEEGQLCCNLDVLQI